MFTGIIECVGVVEKVVTLDTSESGGGGFSITIGGASSILSDCNFGDSISTNGVCLTVTEFDSNSFKVGVAPETLVRTNLGSLKEGSRVNLERAVAGHTRFGGHFVQGHVDTTASITERKVDENSLRLRFKPQNPEVLVYIVEKGFIALDGTSLTVTAVDDETFSVMLIAYTQEKVIISSKQVGESVNVEVDLMGKLVEKQIKAQIAKSLSHYIPNK